MHRAQYDKLRYELGVTDQIYVPKKTDIRLYITTGRQKGRLGYVTHVRDGTITVECEDGVTVRYLYTKLEEVDADGAPLFMHALDITGRPVTGTSVVCYSVSVGAQSHALEIGRVVKTNPSGTLLVQPIIRNGKRLKTYNGDDYHTRPTIRADRAIVLPVDGTLVMTWVLSGFDVYEDGELLR